MLEVFLQRMADNNFVVEDFLELEAHEKAKVSESVTEKS